MLPSGKSCKRCKCACISLPPTDVTKKPKSFTLLPKLKPSETPPVLSNNFQSSPKPWFPLPFLVLGYTGFLQSQRYHGAPPPKSKLIKPKKLSLPMEPEESQYCTPWSKQPVQAHKFGKRTSITTPPFSNFVALASSPNCFPEGTIDVFPLEFNQFSDHETFKKINITVPVQGVIIPKKNPEGGRVICRRTSFFEGGGTVPQNHYSSCGVSVVDDCAVIEDWNSTHYHGDFHMNIVAVISDWYFVSDIDPVSDVLHSPVQIIDFSLPRIERAQFGLKVTIKCMPAIILILIPLMMSVPGLIQLYGSQDNSWGDVLNQMVSTGSVLVGAIFVVLERLFKNWGITSDILKGQFKVKNDFAAKLFAKKQVQELENLACDPRIPRGTIAMFNNSVVRSRCEDGWLRIGSSIKAEDMKNHGYFLLSNQGLVLDVIEAKWYSCYKMGETLQLKRADDETGGRVCSSFEGTEIFV